MEAPSLIEELND